LIQELGVIFQKRGLSAPARAFVDFCVAHRHLLPEVARTRS